MHLNLLLATSPALRVAPPVMQLRSPSDMFFRRDGRTNMGSVARSTTNNGYYFPDQLDQTWDEMYMSRSMGYRPRGRFGGSYRGPYSRGYDFDRYDVRRTRLQPWSSLFFSERPVCFASPV